MLEPDVLILVWHFDPGIDLVFNAPIHLGVELHSLGPSVNCEGYFFKIRRLRPV